MKIVHLATGHRAFDTRIFHKECQALVAAGHEVVFIVPHEQDKSVNGVKIQAVALPKNGRERLFLTPHRVYRLALEHPPDGVFHAHDWDLVFHLFLLRLRGRKVVYDAHEDTPRQILHLHWIPKWLRPVFSKVMAAAEWVAGKAFAGIIAATPTIAERFPASKTVLVRNYPILAKPNPDNIIPYAKRPANVLYAGGISEARGFSVLLDAVERLPKKLQVQLKLAGAFYPAELQHNLPASSQVIEYLGWLSQDALYTYYYTGRIGMVTLLPVPQYLDSYPTKLFEYMAAGLPVIASDFLLWRTFVQASNCGLLVDPTDAQAIAEAITWLLEHPAEAEAMGKRGQKAAYQQFHWDREAKRLIGFYRRLSAESQEASV